MYLSCWLSCTNFEWPLDFNHSNTTCCFLLIVYTVRGALEFNFLLGSGNRWYITRNLHVELNYATKGLKSFRSLKSHLNFSTDSNFTKVTTVVCKLVGKGYFGLETRVFNHQNFDPSLLTDKCWLIFMRMKQNNFFFNSTSSKYFFAKISGIAPFSQHL